MALCNAALEQLGQKIKEEAIITVSAKAEGVQAATWAAKRADQNNSIPHDRLTYSVLFCTPSTQAWKGKKQTSATATQNSCEEK